MQLFISWSKSTSRQFGELLRFWLPEVIHQVKPWMSNEDIDKGQRWNHELTQKLASADEGIVCVTQDNSREPWLNFEAGVLSKALESSVRPILLDVAPAELTGPLASFQLTSATDINDMKRLVRSLNQRCAEPLDENRLIRSFERTWADFLNNVRQIQSDDTKQRRSPEDMLSEVVLGIRSLELRMGSIERSWPIVSARGFTETPARTERYVGLAQQDVYPPRSPHREQPKTVIEIPPRSPYQEPPPQTKIQPPPQ